MCLVLYLLLLTSSLNAQASFGMVGGVLTGALYDPQGNVTQLWAKAGDAGTQLNFIYDALGRIIQHSDAARPGVLEKYFYTAEGLRTRIEEWQGGVLSRIRLNLYNDQRQLVSKYRKDLP